ncbi:MAG: hypothetical protein WBQ08_20975 [Candidatus Sulfotelmatobacter sp.]
MEGLTRLVAESLARYGFDRPVDYRRLHWSRWVHCESPHSLLCIPSKPGVFALAEEVMTFGDGNPKIGASTPPKTSEPHVGTAALGCPAEQSSAGATTAAEPHRMLAVLQFGEDEDMAFVLDRMFALQNPMRARLASGRCFVRFVVIEDQAHRRSIATALNQWLVSSGEKASGIGAHFASSLELTPAAGPRDATDRVEADHSVVSADARVGRTLLSVSANSAAQPAQSDPPETTLDCRPASENASAPHLDSGAATNIHCPQPLPSGF